MIKAIFMILGELQAHDFWFIKKIKFRDSRVGIAHLTAAPSHNACEVRRLG